VRWFLCVGVTALVATSAAASVATAGPRARALVSAAHGIELVARHTEGTFSGYTTGDLSGGWVAVVDHTPLSPNARITGGTLTIVTTAGGLASPLSGRFTRGTITMTDPGANCTDQTFKVVGRLARFGGNRTGVFSVTLKHWRHELLGTCLTYFATANGTLTITQ